MKEIHKILQLGIFRFYYIYHLKYLSFETMDWPPTILKNDYATVMMIMRMMVMWMMMTVTMTMIMTMPIITLVIITSFV